MHDLIKSSQIVKDLVDLVANIIHVVLHFAPSNFQIKGAFRTPLPPSDFETGFRGAWHLLTPPSGPNLFLFEYIKT